MDIEAERKLMGEGKGCGRIFMPVEVYTVEG